MKLRLPEFLHRLRFDLPHPLAGDAEDRAHLFERIAIAIREPEAEPQDLPLPIAQPFEGPRDAGPQRLLIHVAKRIIFAVILHEITHARLVGITQRLVQRHRPPRHPLDARRLLDRQPRQLGQFLDRGIAAMLLEKRLGHMPELGHRVDHVHRHADRAALVGDRAGDGLPDPPGGIRGKLEAPGMLKLVDRPHEAGVTLLNQVEKRQPAIAVALGDRDHQPQIARRQFSLGGVVPCLEVGEPLESAVERAPTLAGHDQDTTSLTDRLRPVRRRSLQPPRRADTMAAAEFLELSQKRIELLNAEVHLFNEPHRLIALADQLPPGGPATRHRHAPRHRRAKEFPFFAVEPFEGFEVRPEPLEETLLLGRVGHRHLDRAVEPQAAVAHLFEQSHRTCQDKVVGEQHMAKFPTPAFDLPGTGHLGLPG